MFLIRFVRTLFVAASILILFTSGSYSQEEEPPAPVKTAGAVWRVGFWEILHQTFSSDDDHPFYQMTGTSLNVGVGLCFTHTNIWMDDEKVRAATSGADPSYATPLLRMASHFYMFSASLHPFGVPAPDDIDIFLGFGFSRVESTIRYGIRSNPTIVDYAPVTQTEISGSAGTMPFRRMGIASGGDSFGFMLEFLLPGKREIIDNPFASNTIIDSTIYDATYNNRGESLPSKVGIPGGITRLSWTYSF